MKKKSRFIPILVLTLMMTILTACTKIEDNRSNIERIRMTSEYLNVLGAFNSVSREFSRAAKLMQESDRRMNQSFDNAFWSEYDEKRSKAEREMRAIKQYQFEFEPFADLKTDFQTMTACMEKYHAVIDRMRGETKHWTPEKKKELYAALDPLYADLLRQSKTIVGKIDNIYNRIFVVGEDKK